MRTPLSTNRGRALCLLGLVFISCQAPAGTVRGTQTAEALQPEVHRLEPPNWWIGLPNPMVMITGENLADAGVTTNTAGVHVLRTANGLSGGYLFVWLDISTNASPGDIHLDFDVQGRHTTASLPLQLRSPAASHPDSGSHSASSQANSGFMGFSGDDVIYLIMPDRFDDGDAANNFPEERAYDRQAARAYHGGDLRGIELRLPYLKNLGVTTLWITPIYQNDDRTGKDYHGYGATDLYAVERHLGTVADFRSLVGAAHSLGLKVLLDMVPNHVGPTNPWVDHPPTDHWFHGTRQRHLAAHSPFDLLTDPHADPREWQDVVEGWFADILPDLATEDPITAEYLRENALWWAETGEVDGFRLDTVPYVDRSFWADFHLSLHETYPRFRTVGEVFHRDPAVTSYFVGGKSVQGIDTGLDTVFDFPLFFAVRNVILQNAPANQIREVLRHDWMFPHSENLVTFIGNHDVKRFMSEPGATLQKLKMAFSLILTLRGIPEIYYGDEIGMRGGEDPDNRRDYPGGFPGDPQSAFQEQSRTPAEQEIFQQVQTLLHLRQEHAALRNGSLIHLQPSVHRVGKEGAADSKAYAYLRREPGKPRQDCIHTDCMLMLMNNADEPRRVELDVHDSILSTSTLIPLMGARPAELVHGNGTGAGTRGTICIPIPARTVSIYEVHGTSEQKPAD